MLKINELNKNFNEAGFLVRSSTYNRLFLHAKQLARIIDSRDAHIAELTAKLRSSVLRDPKTGKYIKRK